MITSSAPSTPQRLSAPNTPSATPGGTCSNPYSVTSSPATPFPSGHPQHPFYIGSSPAPISPAPTPSQAGSTNRLRLIEEALSEESPRTPPPVHHAGARDSVYSRLRAIEDVLNEYQERQGSIPSPQTPTLANSNVETRLSALEAAINHLLIMEAERESLLARQRGGEILDGRDPTSQHNNEILDGHDPTPSHSPHPFLDGRNLTPPRLAVPAMSVAGSSTGPGTLAGEASCRNTGASSSRTSLANAAVVFIVDDDDDDDDDDGEYKFVDYTPEEDAKVEELLQAIHENYLANKKK